jgi:hypothetical protein
MSSSLPKSSAVCSSYPHYFVLLHLYVMLIPYPTFLSLPKLFAHLFLQSFSRDTMEISLAIIPWLLSIPASASSSNYSPFPVWNFCRMPCDWVQRSWRRGRCSGRSRHPKGISKFHNALKSTSTFTSLAHWFSTLTHPCWVDSPR